MIMCLRLMTYLLDIVQLKDSIKYCADEENDRELPVSAWVIIDASRDERHKGKQHANDHVPNNE